MQITVLFNLGSAKHVVEFREFQGFHEGSSFKGNDFLLQYVDASLCNFRSLCRIQTPRGPVSCIGG